MMRQRERAEQPCPNCPLVISGIALARPAVILPPVTCFAGRQTAKPVRRQQLGRADVNNGFLLFPRKQADRQRYGKNLVGPQGSIIARHWSIDYIVTTLPLRIPKSMEVIPKLASKGLVERARHAQFLSELRYGLQRVYPQSIDFDRFADPRRHYPIANFRVHPGQLETALPSIEQAIGLIHMNAVASSSHVRVDDSFQHGIQLSQGS